MTLWIGTSWKMNNLRAEARAFARAVAASPLVGSEAVQLFVIPPFTAVAEVADLLAGTGVLVGVQTMHWAEAGAWTGEISGAMAHDAGARLAEIGHSERRTHFGETDETVALKVAAALRHGLVPLVCVGDTRAEYEAGRTMEALHRQVRAAVSRVSADVTQDAKTGTSFYTARIRIAQDQKDRLGKVQLVPGMPVEAFVQLGDRSVLSYLVKPLSDQISKAWRER